MSDDGIHYSYVEMNPPEGYVGKHAADTLGFCIEENCTWRCDTCGLHMCQCAPSTLRLP